MSLPYSGGCSCGEIRYECSAKPKGMLLRDTLSKFTSEAGTTVYSVVQQLLQGEPHYYELVADSGHNVRRGFCSRCGSQLFAEGDGNPNIVVIKPASLDDPTWFQPQLDIFMDDAQPWDHLDPGLTKFSKIYNSRT